MSSQNVESAVTFTENSFSFVLSGRTPGMQHMRPAVTTQCGRECFEIAETAQDGSTFSVSGSYPASGLEEHIRITLCAENAVVIRRQLKNSGDLAITVHDASLPGKPSFSVPHMNWVARVAHMDNVRLEKHPYCRPEYPYIQPVPTSPTWFGCQESQALPCLILCDDEYNEVLVQGQLSQKATRMRWRLQADDRSPFVEHLVDWEFVGGGTTLQTDESIELEPFYIDTQQNTRPADALPGFFDQAVANNNYRSGAQNVLTRKGFYCSWNYGRKGSIDQASLLETAKTVSENLPDISFFLVDAGWQSREKQGKFQNTGFYLGEQQAVDWEKFPDGMDGFAAKLRDMGLRPGIWWTPFVDLSATMVREHPEWLARNAAGEPFRIGNNGYLDLSVPEVRDYYCYVWDTIFNKWGFEAMKMDFWSQAFESASIRYKDGTATQWRDWFLRTLRSYIPEDGFLMTCVATAMGNIHLGNHAESFRCAIDIGDYNSWREHPLASYWILPLLAIPGRETALLNVDGLGVNPKLSDEENLHRLTWGFITMGSVEVDGCIEQLEPRYIEWLRRLTQNIDRGYPVKCPENEPYTGKPLPRVLYVDYPPESPTYQRGVRKHVALLNWENDPRIIGATAAQLELEEASVEAREFWTDERRTFEAGQIVETLPAHGARLYEIT